MIWGLSDPLIYYKQLYLEYTTLYYIILAKSTRAYARECA